MDISLPAGCSRLTLEALEDGERLDTAEQHTGKQDAMEESLSLWWRSRVISKPVVFLSTVLFCEAVKTLIYTSLNWMVAITMASPCVFHVSHPHHNNNRETRNRILFISVILLLVRVAPAGLTLDPNDHLPLVLIGALKSKNHNPDLELQRDESL